MAFDFPTSPAENQEFTPPGGVTYIYKTPRWQVKPPTNGSGSALDADLLDGQHGSYYLSYLNQTNKPSGYPPATHTHVIGDITNLQISLDAKAPLASPTFNGKATTAASAAGGAGFAVLPGAAPSAPVNGDIWLTTLGLYVRTNGATMGPLGVGGEPAIALGTAAQYWRGDKNWATLDKAAVGLGNVDNTTDLNKPLSTATTSALSGKENTIAGGTGTQYWTGLKAWATLDKAAVGLGNVDNVSDANKAISTATQTALNLKATLADPTFTGDPKAPTPLTADNDTSIATTAFVQANMALKANATHTHTITDITSLQTSLDAKAPLANPSFTGKVTTQLSSTTAAGLILPHGAAPSAPVNGDIWTTTVGLYARINGSTVGPYGGTGSFEPIIAGGLGSQYWTGLKTWATLDKAAVGLANVDNISDANKPVSTAQQTALNGKENTIAGGTSAQYWTGLKAWATLDKAAVGLGNVENTTDLNKPVSTATTTALNLKENTASKNALNGYAGLDGTGKIPSTLLPAYVDDVIEVANYSSLPSTGSTGIIYVTLDNNKTYRWSGLAYVEISSSPGSTDAVPEGSINLYFTAARSMANSPVQSVATRTGAVVLTSTDVGLGNVTNTSDANKPVSTAQQTALNLKANIASPTFTGKTTTQLSSTTEAGLALPHGVAPSAPVNGDIWTTTVGLYARINGQTVGPYGGSGSFEPIIAGGTAAQYWTGLKTWATLDKAAVGLANVDNIADANKPVSTAQAAADALRVLKAGDTMSGGLNFGTAAAASAQDLTRHLALYSTTYGWNVTASSLNHVTNTGAAHNFYAGVTLVGTLGPTVANLPLGLTTLAPAANDSTTRVPTTAWVQAEIASDITGKENTIAGGTSGQYWTGLKTWAALDKTAVGLANVDNTTDANKPISTATATALSGKEPTIAGGTVAQYWRGDKSWQNLPAGGEPPIALGTTLQYWRGDKSWQTLDKTAVGLANVDNTSDVNKPVSTAQAAADALKLALAGGTMSGMLRINTVDGVTSLLLSGTSKGIRFVPSASYFAIEGVDYTGVGSYQPLRLYGTAIILAAATSVPASTATVAGFNTAHGVAPTAPVNGDFWSTTTGFYGRVNGVTKGPFTDDAAVTAAVATKEPAIAMGTTAQYWRGDKSWQTLDKAAVGLDQVDNTSDANKPVSNATSVALNLKANLASPALTGVPTAPTAATGTNTTQLATTAYVMALTGTPPVDGSPADGTTGLNTMIAPGWWQKLVGPNNTNNPAPGTYWWILTLVYVPNYYTQYAYPYYSNDGFGLLHRSCNNGVWGPWSGEVSPGTVAHLARATAPVGWLKANGAAVNRTTYAALFAAIGTVYGAGDGTTTFLLPDLRGEFIRGFDDARGIDSGRAFNSVVQLGGVESHTHPILAIATGGRSAGHTHTTAVSGTTGGVSANHTHSFSDTSSATGNASANHTHEPSTVANSFATNLPTAGTGIAITSSSFATASVATTSASGAAHTHTVAVSGTSGGNSVGHTHTFADNASSSGTESVDHTHTTPATNTVANTGGITETRPRNLAMLACIKY